MHLVSTLFVENFEMRQSEGPSTRIDLTGAFFSTVAPSEPPFIFSPHLVALIYCEPSESGEGVFEVVFRKGPGEDDEQVARNVSPFRVDPGMFTYRLVKAELEFDDYGQVFAHCRVNRDPWSILPLTLLPRPNS
ncbi:MAG: hypothetical protein ACKO3L_06545 [Actinomycetota bacterium]